MAVPHLMRLFCGLVRRHVGGDVWQVTR